MNFTVEHFETKSINVGLFSTKMETAHVATVVFENGDTVHVSRFADEPYWVMDAAFRANGYPLWSNGEGSRVTALRVVDENSDVHTRLNHMQGR